MKAGKISLRVDSHTDQPPDHLANHRDEPPRGKGRPTYVGDPLPDDLLAYLLTLEHGLLPTSSVVSTPASAASPTWHVFRSDINHSDRFAPSWLVCTPDNLWVVEELAAGSRPTAASRRANRSRRADHTPDRFTVARHIPRSQLRQLRTRQLFGNGYVEAVTADETAALVRFTRSRAAAAEAWLRQLPAEWNLVPSQPETPAVAATSAPGWSAGVRGAGGRHHHNRNRAPASPATNPDRCPRCGRPLPPWSDQCPYCINRRQVLGRLLAYVRPYWPQALLMSGLLLVITALQLIPTYLTKLLVDVVFPQHDVRMLMTVVGAMLLIHLVQSALGGSRGYLTSWLGQRIVHDLRVQIYHHLQRLPLTFYDRRHTGAIMSRITGDTPNIQNFLVNSVPQILVWVTTLIGIGGILFTINPVLALLTLLPAPLVALATRRFARRVRRIYQRAWRRNSDLNAVLTDTIPGIAVVKTFTREEYEAQRFATKSDDLFHQYLRAARMENVFGPSMGFLLSLGSIAIWSYGGLGVIRGNGLTLGDLMVFVGYMWQFYGPVQALASVSAMFQQAATAAERVFEILDTPAERLLAEPERGAAAATTAAGGSTPADTLMPVPEPGGRRPPRLEVHQRLDDLPTAGGDSPRAGSPLYRGTVRGEIEFRHVSFSYEGEEYALRDISLRVQPGEMIGLVGSSGSGKTTLVNLIPRFYEPTDGQILIDGVPLRQWDLPTLRQQIGIVLQEPFLFHGTIGENIAYGNPNATSLDVMRAAQAANAHEFIMDLPDSYDSVIGERGVGLSGGQKQRISIARAILKNPRILILDEATSAVDTETEKLIQEALERLVSNRTTLAIAHRLSTLRNADRIVVVDDGTLVESGTPEQLLASGGQFAYLWHLQTELSHA